jgi:hypothetical protein
MNDPTPTPQQYAEAAAQLRNAPDPGTAPPPEAEVAAGLAVKQSAAPAGVTEVDIEQLMAAMKAMQARVDALEAEKAAGNAAPVKGNAEVMRELLRVHAAHNPGTDHGDVLRLADDMVDAAGNAAETGDAGIIHELAGKMERALTRVHPGPGDHSYFAQALDFAKYHMHDSADQLTRKPPPAPAIGSDRPPAQVVQGNVTG